MSSETKAEEYERTMKKVVVTYHDNVNKTFTPAYWAIYETQVSKIAKHIKIYKRRASIWSRIKRFFKSLFKK